LTPTLEELKPEKPAPVHIDHILSLIGSEN